MSRRDMEEDKRMSIALITQLIFDAATNLAYNAKDKKEVVNNLYDLVNWIDEFGVKID